MSCQRTAVNSEEHISNHVLFFHGWTALGGPGLLMVEVSRSHPDPPHSVGLLWTSDRPSQGHVPESTQHSTQEKDIHATGGIRTHNSRKRAAAELRLSK